MPRVLWNGDWHDPRFSLIRDSGDRASYRHRFFLPREICRVGYISVSLTWKTIVQPISDPLVHYHGGRQYIADARPAR